MHVPCTAQLRYLEVRYTGKSMLHKWNVLQAYTGGPWMYDVLCTSAERSAVRYAALTCPAAELADPKHVLKPLLSEGADTTYRRCIPYLDAHEIQHDRYARFVSRCFPLSPLVLEEYWPSLSVVLAAILVCLSHTCKIECSCSLNLVEG